MTAIDHKRLMKMDRLQLMELLQQISREMDALSLRAAQLEAANAKLSLAAREAEAERDDALRQLEKLRAAQIDLNALPTGSFAEAMVQTAAIVEKTQTAADAYLAQAKATAGAAQQQADALLDSARAEADALLAAARSEADALTAEAAAAKARMDSELQGMSQRLHAEMAHITSLMQGISVPEADA